MPYKKEDSHESHDEPNDKAKSKKEEVLPDGTIVIGEASDKTRSFQTAPNTREHLTQEEAENPPKDKDGNPTRPKFYWAPDKNAPTKEEPSKKG